jgi:hypothetical protein
VFGENTDAYTLIGAENGPDIEAALTRLHPALQHLEESAPEEIRSDLERNNDHRRKVADLLEKHGYSFERLAVEATSEEQKVFFEDAADPQLIASFDRLASFVESNCPGVTVPR